MEEKRAKRIKDKDNPYTLHIVDNGYRVDFVDVLKVKRQVNIDEKIYISMNTFELEDKSQMNRYTNNIEHVELTEEQLSHRVMTKPISIDETVEMNEEQKEVRKAVNSLPEIQRRRIIKKFFYEMTFEEIAKEEHVDIRAVQYTLDIAIKKLRKKLGNLNKF